MAVIIIIIIATIIIIICGWYKVAGDIIAAVLMTFLARYSRRKHSHRATVQLCHKRFICYYNFPGNK